MTITLEGLKDYITHNVDEVDVLEHLNLTAEDLVEAFTDKIEDKFDKLVHDLELEGEENIE